MVIIEKVGLLKLTRMINDMTHIYFNFFNIFRVLIKNYFEFLKIMIIQIILKEFLIVLKRNYI